MITSSVKFVAGLVRVPAFVAGLVRVPAFVAGLVRVPALPEVSRLLLQRSYVLAAIALVCSGCPHRSDDISDVDLRGSNALSGSQDHLARAIGTLERLDQYDQQQARAKVVAQLSQWIESQPPVDDWSVDPLVNTLPGRYTPVFQYAPLRRMQFVGTDANALSEAVWMRQIVRWQTDVLRDRHPDLFLKVEDLTTDLRKLQAQRDDTKKSDELEEQITTARASLADAEAQLQLLTTQWLFDWTVRNIQLDATHWDAEFPESEEDAAEKLVPPPGAALHPWQAMLLGHGDAVTRARVFVLLARQANIDVVMLGLKSEDDKKQPREWAAAAMIGDQLYLFDAELGLPIPGPEDAEVGTLAQLREQPELLRQLDTDEFPYPVKADDLSRLVPLIDAGLEALSQRMLLVQQTLRDEQALVLTVEPSPLARRLRKLKLDDARIWEAPYRVYIYEALRQQHPEVAGAFHQQMTVFVPPIELWKARLHHFRGQVDEPNTEAGSAGSNNYQHGARYFYLACRDPAAEIEAIQQELEAWFAQDASKTRGQLIAELRYEMYVLNEYKKRRSDLKAGDIDPAEQFYRQRLEADALQRNPDLADRFRGGQRELTPQELEDVARIEAHLKGLSPTTLDWIERSPQMLTLNEDDRGNFIEHFQKVVLAAKQHATWWLGIAALEGEQLGVAISFFDQRILNTDTDSPWAEHAHAQLGRIFEIAGQSEQAIKHYQLDQSPGRAGSLIRAQRL